MIILETERLTIRHVVTADAAFIVELVNEPAYIANIADQVSDRLTMRERTSRSG